MAINDTANQRIAAFEQSLHRNGRAPAPGPCYAGVDLGTAYIVTALVDSDRNPVTGALTRSASSIRDGLVLDYVAAISILKRQIEDLSRAGFKIHAASAAFPPGTMGRNAETFANVLRAVGLDVAGLIDEPTAASLVLEISDGAVVDIGGGTTGISILHGGEVVYTADEPTGGTHIDLVLAGNFKIDPSEAEQLKRDPAMQWEIFPLIRPVFERMASIVRDHIRDHAVETLYLVGGTSCFPGIEEVMARETGLVVERPVNPLLVTPLGIALSCAQTH